VSTETFVFGKVMNGGPQVVRAEPHASLVLVHLPINHSADYRIGRRTLRAHPNQLIVIPPEYAYTVRHLGGMSFSLMLNAELLIGELDDLSPGRRGHAALKACEIKLSRNEVADLFSLRQAMILAATDPEGVNARHILIEVERNIVIWLAGQVVRQGGVTPLSERRRRRVAFLEGWVDQNLGEPIDLGKLTEITGVGAHALAKATSAARGVSPMGLVLTRRLKKARELMTDGTQKRVAEVAHFCGFSHLGRFAAEYHAAFGEKPVDTLGRRGDRRRHQR